MTTAEKLIQGSEIDAGQLLERTVEENASDLHFTVGLPPMLRIYGKLVPLNDFEPLRPPDTERIARELTNERQWETFVRDKELDFSMGRSRLARFRINLFWQRGSVAVALRSIPFQVPTLEDLKLPDVLKAFALTDHGLFIVTGPTGSGKSTTLAAMVNHINENRHCHIVTIEDPIEYLHHHKNCMVNQREMFSDTTSFRGALKHVLRQDPDVVLIGEMRDIETIETALTLAETGHLVLATLHTGDAAQAVTRIIDVYPPHQQPQVRTQLSIVLTGVMVQQLIRNRDGSGRVLAHEILVGTPAVGHMIRSNEIQQIYSAIQTGGADGMHTLNSKLLDLYRTRQISREDALHKSSRRKELVEAMGRLR
jgi:twitching motility protein PilT